MLAMLLAPHAWAQGVRVGLDVLLDDPALLAGRRVGVVANATSVNAALAHAVDLIAAHPLIRLEAIFAPEHGFRGAKQAGEGVGNARDHRTGLPIYSLYGVTRRPTAAMLEPLDVIVVDLQDIGTRFYTYISTLYEVLAAAAEHGKAVVVLDRPNPLGGLAVEGPVLEPAYTSFVGAYPIPIRHGLTIGEIALLMNRTVGADLTVVPMSGWRRQMRFADTGLVWVMPSPNMPTPETALVYPGTGLLEGTNLSEGRGTTRPFELIGAPFIDPEAFAAHLNALGLPGVRFRPASFVPMFDKYAGQVVHGVQLHVVDEASFEPVRTALAVLAAARDRYPEFAIDRPAHFDALAGNGWLRQGLVRGVPIGELVARWQPELSRFLDERQEVLLYD